MIAYSDLKSPTVSKELAWPLDFDVSQTKEDMSWVKLSPNQPYKLLATEGSGGVYLAYGDSILEKRPILYASSEGQSGKIANNLTEFLSILMAIPYWFDLLKFSGNGSLKEMCKTACFMEKEYNEEHPELQHIIKSITKYLNIPDLENPIEVLHNRVNATDCTLVADDGWKYETLFNSFTSSDNPDWS